MATTKSKLGRGRALKNQTKEVLHKIYKYFEAEIERDPNSTVTAAQLVSHATGVSVFALRRVISETQSHVAVKTEPSKRKKRKIPLEDSHAQAIRRVIHNFYTSEEEFPVMKDLYLIMKGECDYQGSLCTLRRHVAKLGFKWVNKSDSSCLLIEKHDVRYTRIQYLTKLEIYRAQGRNIVYTGETTLESNRVSTKPKPDGSSTMLKQPAKTKTVLLVAGDCHGLLKNTVFFYEGNKKDFKDDNDKKDNFDVYEKWLRVQVVLNLPPNSIVVVDSGLPAHNKLSNPAPHSNSTKKEMIDYLTAKNVPYSCEMYKPQLYQLVLLNKDKSNDYKTDVLLREYGHTVLRLPPYHPDLNPIKITLASVTNYLGKNGNVEMQTVMKIAKEKLYSFTSEEWKHFCWITEAEENSLKATDKVIDAISEQTFVDREEEDESEGEDETVSDQDSLDSD